MKRFTILFALALCMALAGCNQATSQGEESTQEPTNTVTTPTVDESTDPTLTESEQMATLHIGTKAGGFTEYPMTYEGELTPELLIQGIADLSGWDLTLAEPVISGKGGMSVCLSNESSLFTGPPDPQKEEFHMYDAEQLAETILDSIQKTLQKGFVLEPGDPDTLDIWYYTEGTQPLELPNLGLSWPIDQPYQWVEGQRNEDSHSGNADTPVINAISILNDEWTEISQEETGWFPLPEVCKIKVDYNGIATKAEFYAAPTGTETDTEKTLIGTVDVDRTANSVSLEWEPDGFMGYISVILYNDSAAVSSEDNWLIKVISDEQSAI